MERCLTLIATDFAALYREVTSRRLLTSDEFSIDAFQAVFDSMHVEYLHYAGSSATQPFLRDVVESVLQLAAAYLLLPTCASPTGRAFGLYLLFFLYATQPIVESTPVKVRVALGTLESYLNDADSAVADPPLRSSSFTVGSDLGHRVTDGERRVLLALHKVGAWHVVPFVDASAHIQTLLRAHEAAGVPLVTSGVAPQLRQRRVDVPKTDGALARQLEAYEAMKRRVGLHGALDRR